MKVSVQFFDLTRLLEHCLLNPFIESWREHVYVALR